MKNRHPSFSALHFRHSGHGRRLFGGHDPESTSWCSKLDSRGNDVNLATQIKRIQLETAQTDAEDLAAAGYGHKPGQAVGSKQ